MSNSSKLHTKQAMAARVRRLEAELATAKQELRESKRRESTPFVNAVKIRVEKQSALHNRYPTHGVQVMLSPDLFANAMWQECRGNFMRDLDYEAERVGCDVAIHVRNAIIKAVKGEFCATS